MAVIALLGAGCPGGGAHDDDAGDDDGADDDAGDDDTGDDDASLHGNDAAFASQAVPATVDAGAAFSVEITMTNTGQSTWSGDEYALGSQNPQDNTTWGAGRLHLESGVAVAPGESYTFAATLNAPAAAGTFDLQWRMLQEDVEWFGDLTPDVAIEVAECGDACSDGALDCGETDVDCGGPCGPCPVVELVAGRLAHPAVGASGELVIVTFGDEDDGWRLHYTCRDAGGWTAPQPVPGLGSDAEFSRLAVDGQGRIHLVAHQGLGDDRGVYHARFDGDAGCAGTWTAVTRVDDGTRNSCWPAISVDQDDAPHLLWTEDYLQMQYSRAAGGVWQAPTIVVDTPDEQSCHGDLTVDGTTPHTVWQEGTSPRIPTWSRWTGAGFSAPEPLSDEFHNWPQIVADGHGRLHVLFTYRYGGHEVKYVRFDNGAWSAEQTVSSGDTAWTWTDLEVDALGQLHATWSQSDAVEQVYYAVADGATGSWEAPRRVSSDESLHDHQSTISVDPQGRAHLVWIRVSDPTGEEPGPVDYRVVTWADLAP